VPKRLPHEIPPPISAKQSWFCLEQLTRRKHSPLLRSRSDKLRPNSTLVWTFCGRSHDKLWSALAAAFYLLLTREGVSLIMKAPRLVLNLSKECVKTGPQTTRNSIKSCRWSPFSRRFAVNTLIATRFLLFVVLILLLGTSYGRHVAGDKTQRNGSQKLLTRESLDPKEGSTVAFSTAGSGIGSA
jgi:hypothetical protein